MSEIAAYLGELGVVTNKDVVENSSSLDLHVRRPGQTGFARVGWVHRDKQGEHVEQFRKMLKICYPLQLR